MRISLILMLLTSSAVAADWPQYRGPQGMGIAGDSTLPIEFGVDENLIWRTAIPAGHSSPVLSKKHIFLTGYSEKELYVFALNRADGRLLWRKSIPRPRIEPHNKTHGGASPTPVTDGENVYAFFGDFGLISYGPDGTERWRRPMGPFDNINGHGSSPILVEGKLIFLLDQNVDSFLMAIDPADGTTIWSVDRSEVTKGYGTPGVFRPSDGPVQLVIPGAYRVVSYALGSGEKLWWVNGMAWQLKCVPVVDGDIIYINAWESGGDPGQRKETLSYPDALKAHDADGDGQLSRAEIPADQLKGDRNWIEHDLDADGLMGQRDWDFYAARRAPINNLVAIRPGGRRGDITKSGVLWRYWKSLPNTPSPLLLDGVLYLVKDGGIMQSVDPESGEPFKLARLPTESIDKYWSSPISAGGKIYLVNEACTVTVLEPGQQWEAVAVNPIDDRCLATPAIADDRLYLRGAETLYAFGSR